MPSIQEESNIRFVSRFFNFSVLCLNISLNKFQGVISFHCELVNMLGP